MNTEKDTVYKREIVPFKDWVKNPYFLGGEANALRSYWKDRLSEYFDSGYTSFIFTGSARSGKTYASLILILRYIYEISCYKSFPSLCGLSPTTIPKIVYISYTKEKARSQGLSRLIRMVESIPYFQQHDLKMKDKTSVLDFPFLQVVPASNSTHVIGEDSIGAIMDESNVRRVAKGTEVKEAQELFLEIKMRGVMTYSKDGKSPAFSGIISTASEITSFTEVEIAKAREYNSAFLVQASQYEVQPHKYSKKKFDVCLGDGDGIDPFIMSSVDSTIKNLVVSKYGMSYRAWLKQNKDRVIQVPEDLKSFYLEDLGYSLKNISGISQRGLSKLFTSEKLLSSIFTLRDNPNMVPIPEIGIFDKMTVYDFINTELIEKMYTGYKIYSHADLSTKHDRTALAFVHYDTDAKKIRSSYYSSFFYDKSIEGNEIDQTKIVLIHQTLYDLGYSFGYCSADQYASTYYLQRLTAMMGKEKVGTLSVDTSPDAYLYFSFLLKKKKLEFYKNPLLLKELVEVEYNKQTGKIDHPKNTNSNNPVYYKDLADAVVGAVWNLGYREDISEESVVADIVYSNAIDNEDDFYTGLEKSTDGFYEDCLEGIHSTESRPSILGSLGNIKRVENWKDIEKRLGG